MTGATQPRTWVRVVNGLAALVIATCWLAAFWPMIAIPVVSQHALNAVVLYGSHVNGTLPDPDEVDLLEALAQAAAGWSAGAAAP